MDRFRAMQIFVEVARCGSFSTAAKELDISRPLVSLHLKQLEDHIGSVLINRTTRQFSLTSAGMDYLSFCKSILASIADKEGSLAAKGPTGALKILCSASFGNYELAPVAGLFARKYPDVSLEIIVTDSFISSPQLIDDGYDLAFLTRLSAGSATNVASKICETVWVACAAPEYLRKSAALVSPKDLKQHNCLSHRSFIQGKKWRFRKNRTPHDVQVRGAVFSNSVMILRQAALNGIGIALLPLYCIRDDLASGLLEQVLSDFDPPSQSIFAIRPRKQASETARLFLDFARTEFRKMDKGRDRRRTA